MCPSETNDGSVTVLTATAGVARIGIPSAQVRGVATVTCSPALPWSPPWWRGVAEIGGKAVWVLDLMGLLRDQPQTAREATVITVASGSWALAITAPGAMASARPAGGVEQGGPSAQGPSAWWRACRFADGGRGVLVEVDAIDARVDAKGTP